MSRLTVSHALIALVYQDSARAEALLLRLAEHLRAHRLRLAGLLQHTVDRPNSARCAMELEDLTSGDRTSINDDRGSGVLACTLDADALLRALVRAKAGLDSSTDLLLLNKFGKMEAEGGGFRPLIVAALEQEIPAIVAVPERNLAAWQSFAEGISVLFGVETLPWDPQALLSHLGIRFLSKSVEGCAAIQAS